MSFKLQINNKVRSKALEISFLKHFCLPVSLLVVLILSASFGMSEYSSSVSPWQFNSATLNTSEMDRLQREIATLEGESQRLKAFAKKMVKLAKLDAKVFDFDQPPAMGGLDGSATVNRHPSIVAKAVDQDIKHIAEQLKRRSNQLERMQLILKSRAIGRSSHLSKWPVKSAYLSSKFGLRKDPFTGRLRKHNGIDLAGPRGSDIMSVADGVVVFAGRKGGYGNVVEIEHSNGHVSRYAHLEKSLVKLKQFVKAGETIALLGSSGRSTGPHLHLEIIKNNKNIDPMLFLGKRHSSF